MYVGCLGLYHPRLLGEIARGSARRVTAAIRPLSGEREIPVGIALHDTAGWGDRAPPISVTKTPHE